MGANLFGSIDLDSPVAPFLHRLHHCCRCGFAQARQGSTGGTGTETKASGGQNTAERNPTSGTGGTGTAAKTDPAGTGAGTTAATGNKQADGAEDTDGWMEWDDMQ